MQPTLDMSSATTAARARSAGTTAAVMTAVLPSRARGAGAGVGAEMRRALGLAVVVVVAGAGRRRGRVTVMAVAAADAAVTLRAQIRIQQEPSARLADRSNAGPKTKNKWKVTPVEG